MIVVKIEMWPHGDEAAAYPLGHARITNLGTGNQTGDYVAELHGSDGRVMNHNILVENFPRRDRHVWDLLTRVLQKAGRG